MHCPRCGCTDSEHSASMGNVVCIQCGFVFRENEIVNEVQWADGAAGAPSVLGQYVSTTAINRLSASAKSGKRGGLGGIGGGGGVGNRSNTNVESREHTLGNGKRLIGQIADRIRCKTHLIEAAFKIFTLAVNMNFIQGRRTIHVVAACLYTAIRREAVNPQPILLIDLADAINVNVYILGAVFLKLLKACNWTVRTLDPSLYILRFAGNIFQGDSLAPAKIHSISMTALRLVSSMKHHWITTGRRPTGICGACLVIAAKIHGHEKTPGLVAQIVRITSTTIKKRLTELLDTSHAQLSVEDFEKLDREDDFNASFNKYSTLKGANSTARVEHAITMSISLPPAFSRNRRIENKQEDGNSFGTMDEIHWEESHSMRIKREELIADMLAADRQILEQQRDEAIAAVEKLLKSAEFRSLVETPTKNQQMPLLPEISASKPDPVLIPSKSALRKLIKGHLATESSADSDLSKLLQQLEDEQTKCSSCIPVSKLLRHEKYQKKRKLTTAPIVHNEERILNSQTITEACIAKRKTKRRRESISEQQNEMASAESTVPVTHLQSDTHNDDEEYAPDIQLTREERVALESLSQPGEDLRVLLASITPSHQLPSALARLFETTQSRRKQCFQTHVECIMPPKLEADSVKKENNSCAGLGVQQAHDYDGLSEQLTDEELVEHLPESTAEYFDAEQSLHVKMLPFNESQDVCEDMEQVSMDEIFSEETLEGIDDEEIANAIVSPEEFAFRSRLWDELNRDWLIKSEQKRLIEVEALKSGRIRRPRKRGTQKIPTNTAEAARTAAERKKSSRINYEKLRNVFGDGPGLSADEHEGGESNLLKDMHVTGNSVCIDDEELDRALGF